MRNGFTLVELSIVLVIIGLLIGGILVAQSMVATTKLESFVRQIQQYDAAVSNFHTKYNYLPGDSPLNDPPGDGDGFISIEQTDHEAFRYETAYFWKHMSDMELPGTNYQDGSLANELDNGLNCPYVKIGVGTTILAMAVDPVWGQKVFPDGTNVWVVRTGAGSNYNLMNFQSEPNNASSLTPEEALSIDAKMDDGIANAGNVRATDGYVAGLDPTYQNSGCVLADVSMYDTSQTTTTCGISIIMLSQVGQNQPN